MSAFFSIHYLTVYYLLQPYTAGTELKSGTYRIVMVLTYVVCYALINVRMPILVFGAMCIAFCVAYSIVASILVYKFAPRTFGCGRNIGAYHRRKEWGSCAGWRSSPAFFCFAGLRWEEFGGLAAESEKIPQPEAAEKNMT